MDKKKDAGRKQFSFFGALRSAVSKVGSTVDVLKSEFEETVADAKKRIHQITESLFSRIMSLFLIMLGLVFLFLGTVYTIIEAGLNKSSSFLIVGVLILVLGWVFMMLIRRGN